MPRRSGRGECAEDGVDAPRAGDMARQIGEGFVKIACVIDECPPLAKLFEGGFLERRFQEVFQGSGAVIGANLASHAMGSGSEVARKESTQQTGSAGSMGGTMARDQMEGNGRGACRGSGQGSSETEARQEKRDGGAGAASSLEGDVSRSTGVGLRGRPPTRNRTDSAQRGPKPSLPVPSFGAPPPPPRAAAAAALERISAPKKAEKEGMEGRKSSMESTGSLMSDNDSMDVKAPASTIGRRKSSEGQGSAAGGRGERDGPSLSTRGGSKGGSNSTRGSSGPGTRSSSAPPAASSSLSEETVGGDETAEESSVSGYPIRARRRIASGESSTPNYCEVGEARRRRSEAEMLDLLDTRVFAHVGAGECRIKGCELRVEAHCHRGPGCDCTRNSETYRWPSELQSMLRHQERHCDWNNRPAFGKRVLVKFADGNFYAGTINTRGESAKDRRHSRGRWGVIFDDCTFDRFEDNAGDVMVTNQPRPTEMNEELRDYYNTQENGKMLLAGVVIVADSSDEEESVPVDEVNPRKKRKGVQSRKPHAASGSHKARGSSKRARRNGGLPEKTHPLSVTSKPSSSKRKAPGSRSGSVSDSSPRSSTPSLLKTRKQGGGVAVRDSDEASVAVQRNARDSRAKARGASRVHQDDDDHTMRDRGCSSDAEEDIPKSEVEARESSDDEETKSIEGCKSGSEELVDKERDAEELGAGACKMDETDDEDETCGDRHNAEHNDDEKCRSDTTDPDEMHDRCHGDVRVHSDAEEEEGHEHEHEDEDGDDGLSYMRRPEDSDSSQKDGYGKDDGECEHEAEDEDDNEDEDGEVASDGDTDDEPPTVKEQAPSGTDESPRHFSPDKGDYRDPITPETTRMDSSVGWVEHGDVGDTGSGDQHECDAPPLNSGATSTSVAAPTSARHDRRRAAVLSIADLTAVENAPVARKDTSEENGSQQRGAEWVSIASSDASPKPDLTMSVTEGGDDEHGTVEDAERDEVCERDSTRATVVPISASDPHALEVAHVMISAMGLGFG